MSDLFIFEAVDLPPMQKKKATIIIGRFQPPHLGHYKVIQQAWKFTKKHDLDALILVIVEGINTSKDTVANPLSADERIRYIKNSGRANWVKDILVSTNAFDAMKVVRDAGYEPIAIAAGDDRADKYLGILDKYFLDNDGNPIKHMKVDGLERENLDTAKTKKLSTVEKSLEKMKQGSELDVEEASGTLARTAAKNGFYDEFVKIVGLEKNKAAAKQMYSKIRKSMGVED